MHQEIDITRRSCLECLRAEIGRLTGGWTVRQSGDLASDAAEECAQCVLVQTQQYSATIHAVPSW